MNSNPSPPSEVKQNPQTALIIGNLLQYVIPALIGIIGSLIVFQQTKIGLQIPIAATQTAEAKLPLLVITTSTAPATVPVATEHVAGSEKDNVDVLLNNPNASAPSVQVIIKQNDEVIANLILPPGGVVPKISLPPGSYQVEARPLYPPITPSSANCEIRWQLGESYTRDLVITSGEAVIQIQQFDLKPLEVCPGGTQTPTPNP
jgi:hypothetical protein